MTNIVSSSPSRRYMPGRRGVGGGRPAAGGSLRVDDRSRPRSSLCIQQSRNLGWTLRGASHDISTTAGQHLPESLTSTVRSRVELFVEVVAQPRVRRFRRRYARATEAFVLSGGSTVIKPASRWPHLDISELWHYRELLQTLVWRDVVVRYKQTFLGVGWAILVPVFTATVYIIVFGKFANFPAGDIPTRSRDRRRAAHAVLRLVAHRIEPEPRREPPARHEGVLPARAPAAGRGHRPDDRLHRRLARADRPDVVLRNLAGRLGIVARTSLPGARDRSPRSAPASCSRRSTSGTATSAT